MHNFTNAAILVAECLYDYYQTGELVVYDYVGENYDPVEYGHWAYEALTWAVDNGVLVGTSKDKLNPDGYLTRAQMAAMIDRLFGTYKSADISRYTDVSRGNWYYDYIAQAVHMGTFAGYSNSHMGPNDNTTREQTIVVLARTVCLPSAGNAALARFPDRGVWAADSVAAMVERGYVSGYHDGRLNPKGQITRAGMAQIMCNIFQNVHDSGEITGTYRDTVLVRGAANIKDAVFESDLIIANGLGEKSLDLNNITVKGRLVVWGGSTVNVSGKSTVAGVVTPRNDGPVQVTFDAAATELSQKGCSIVKPSTMDQGNKVLFTDKADKPTIAFDLPAYRYVGDSLSVKTTLTDADAVTWELTRDEKPVTMPEGFTKDGGTCFFMEAGRYPLKGTVENSGGTAVCEKTVEVLPSGDIAFSLPEYGYTDQAEDVKLLTKNNLTDSVVWTLTKDGTAQNLTSFTRDGGTLSLTETGKYTLMATLTDAAGKKYTASQTITILPEIVPTMTASADKVHEDETAEISLTMNGGNPAAVSLSGTDLDVTWEVASEDGAVVENDLNNEGGEITFPSAGNYTVTASVMDHLGRTFTVSGTISVWDTMGLSFRLPEFTHPDETVKVKMTSENVGDSKIEWSLAVDGQPVSLPAGINGTLDNAGGGVRFLQIGTNILTASVTDGLGRAFTYERTIEVYPVLHLKLTADAATHTDEQISVTLEKDTDLPAAWSVTPSNDPATATV